MKEIELTQGQVALVDDEDYPELSGRNWSVYRGHSGYYAHSRINGQHCTMHRFLLGLSAADERVVDHINHNTLDNRRENLRICETAENVRNKVRYKNCASGLKGVTAIKTRWRAMIQVNRRHIHLGYFDSPTDAARAYDAAAVKYHKEFAFTNSPSA